MYKVLIADDEEKVCQLISKIIDWEALGLEIVGIANDGKSAVNLIAEKLPDIVITDIRMPGYDGLELIEKSKQINNNIHFIIISGYRQFDYARKAIKYGVEDYLLKPLREEELLDIIIKMLEKISNEKHDQQKEKSMKNQIETDAKRVRENFLDDLIESTIGKLNSLSREECNKIYRCNFVDGYYQAIVIKPDIPRKDYNMDSYLILLGKAMNIAEVILTREEGLSEYIAIMKEEGIFFLLNKASPQTDNQLLRKKVTRIRNNICGLRDLFWDIQVTVGIGKPVEDFSSVPQTIKSARHKILSRVFYGAGTILQGEHPSEKSKVKVGDFFDVKSKKMLLEYFETRNKAGVCKILDEMKDIVLKSGEQDGELLFGLVKELLEIFIFAMKNINLQKNMNDLHKQIIQNYHICTDVDEIFDMLQNYFMHYIRLVEKEKEKVEMKPIRDAKKYINENYAKQLKLEDMGAMAGFNSSYFSALFKKETGKNFSEYLIEVRIQKAKELLIEKNLGIPEIAERVGYSDMKYFNKIFKKETDLTPSEFRKMYL